MTEVIPISKFKVSPWNFNAMSEEMKETLAEDIKANGIGEKILVRPVKDYLKIIDGEQRVSVLRDKLGWVEIGYIEHQSPLVRS